MFAVQLEYFTHFFLDCFDSLIYSDLWKILSDVCLACQNVRKRYEGVLSSHCGFEEMGEQHLLHDHFCVWSGGVFNCNFPFKQWEIDEPNKLTVDKYFLDVKNCWLDNNRLEIASLFMFLFSQTTDAKIVHEIGI